MSGYVAIKDFNGHDKDGWPVEFRKGITHVSGGWSGLNDPAIRALLAPEGSRPAYEAVRSAVGAQSSTSTSSRSPSSFVLPAGTTVIEKPPVTPATRTLEPVELRLKATPKVTVHMHQGVWDRFGQYFRDAQDGRETAGFLFGDPASRGAANIWVSWTTSMVTNRRVDAATLDILALVKEKATLHRMESRKGEQGCWHTHPWPYDKKVVGWPSPADMQAWLSARDFMDTPFYVGMILTAHPTDERWWKPDVHAWIVRRDDYLGNPVCEPALFEVARR